jgi:hypothetical protein
MRSTLHSALFCSGLPLVAGLLIFLLWFRHGGLDLQLKGWLLLLTGWLPVLMGFGFLLGFRSEARQRGVAVGEIRRATWWVVLLGLANFPAAALVLYAVQVCKSHCAFTLVNQSGGAVRDIELRAGTELISLGKLGPAQTRLQRVFIRPTGAYRVTARSATREFDSVDNAYSSPGLAAQMLISFEASGSLLVEEFDDFD